MRWLKIWLCLFFIGASIAIVGYHDVLSFYPLWPVTGGVLCLSILVFALKAGPEFDTKQIIFSLVLVALFYRVGMFLLSPSLIGVDTIKHAVQIQWVVESGTSDVLTDFFYRNAAAFQVYSAEVAILTGLRADHTLVVWPLLVGLFVPLMVAGIARGFSVPGDRRVVVAVAGSLSIAGTSTIWFGVAPVAQLIGLPLLLVAVYATIQYLKMGRLAHLIVLLAIFPVLLFAHKLPILVIVTWFLGLAASTHSLRLDSFVRDMSRRLMAISVTVLVIQWAYLTEFLRPAVLNGVSAITTLVTRTGAFGGGAPTSSHAVLVSSSMVAAILDKINLIILPVGFLAAVILTIYCLRYRNPGLVALLSVLAPMSVLVALGTFGSLTGGSMRYLLFDESLLAITIAVAIAISHHYLRSRNQRTTAAVRQVAVIVVILVVIAQFGAANAAPDHTDTPRLYLSSQEIASKHFETEHVPGTVYSDRYYATFVVDPTVPVRRGDAAARSLADPGELTDALRNATIVEEQYPYVTVRESVEIHRLDGGRWYRLTWNQETVLSATYNRVYDNGAVSSYDYSTSRSPNSKSAV
jgi:hypothetical protein